MVLHYTPPNSDGSGLRLILATPFELQMLAKFGQGLVLMDSTGGTNMYGYVYVCDGR